MPPLTPTRIASDYAEALRLIAQGQPEAALKLLAAIIESNPDIPEAHFQIGRLFVAGDRYDRALTHFRVAARLKPVEPAIWAGWAGAVALAGDGAAERAYKAALKAAPIPGAIRIALQDRFGANRASSKPALGGAAPAAVAALVRAMAEQRFAAAETGARDLLRRHPGAAIAANVLGSALAAQGKPTEALPRFHDAIRLDPLYAEAHANLGHLLTDLGRQDEAGSRFAPPSRSHRPWFRPWSPSRACKPGRARRRGRCRCCGARCRPCPMRCQPRSLWATPWPGCGTTRPPQMC